MFKKLANLFFEEVEEEEFDEKREKATTSKSKKKPKEEKKEKIVVKKEVSKKEDKEKLEQKSFVKKKEKSIFIDNKEKVVKKAKPKKVEKEEDYEFTPIISPIRGLRETDKKTYEVRKSKKEGIPITVSRLGTILSPIHGLGKGKNKETFDKIAKLQEKTKDSKVLEIDEKIIKETLKADVDLEVKEDKIIENEKVLKQDDNFFTLDQMLSKDLNEKDMPHYFIGIKGTGMAALATLLDDAGYHVLGSDTEDFVFTQRDLNKKEIEVLPFDKNNIKDDMVVIIGNSFYDDHPEVAAAKANDTIKTYTYHGFLGKFIEDYNSIAVSGSHGKTTTTSMIADMLSLHGPNGHLIGDGRGQVDADAKSMVIEACEYKRHFLSYKADFGIITNLEWDHVDYYKTNEDYLYAFEQFANQIKDTVLVFGDDPDRDKLNIETKVLYYGENEENDVRAVNIEESDKGSSFDVIYKGENIGNFKIKLVGRHMVYNALAAIAIGKIKGLDNHEINDGINNYKGAHRRFETVEIGDSVVIDDYAHHPTEVDVTIDAAKIKYPNHRLVAIYHPDRIARLNTFIEDYVSALKKADEIAISKAVDSDGMTKEIDLEPLLSRLGKAFVVEDSQQSISKLAHLSPAVYLLMGTKEMHEIKVKLIEYLKRIDI